MSSPQFYYMQNDQRHGPISGAKLKALYAAGQLKDNDLVWREGLQAWVPVSIFPVSAPTTNDELLDLVRKSCVLDEKKLDAYMENLRAANATPSEPVKLAGLMVRVGLLTNFQAEQLCLGKWRRFNIGKYKVLERLGHGGMGSVFLCEHKFLGRRVAVKVLPVSFAENPSLLERFHREARAVAALDHPNIVRAYDIDQDENLHFLVMEYIEGADLARLVRERGRLPLPLAAEYICQAALGLQHAHENELVHRDIKPQNLMLTAQAVIKLTDFGLARFHTEAEFSGPITVTANGDWQLTTTGAFLGTPAYMAPEQAYDASRADIRADIFGLGCTLFYLLTRQSPYPGRTLDEKLAAWQGVPTQVHDLRPDVLPELDDVLARALARQPSDRYQTPAELYEALRPFISSSESPGSRAFASESLLSDNGAGSLNEPITTTDYLPPRSGME